MFPRPPSDGLSLHSRFWISFPNLPAQSRFIIGLITPPRDEPLHRVQQFQPVLQRRVWHRLPDIKPLFAMKKFPITPNALDVHLQLHALIGHAFPADFGLWHLADFNLLGPRLLPPSPRSLLRARQTPAPHSSSPSRRFSFPARPAPWQGSFSLPRYEEKFSAPAR